MNGIEVLKNLAGRAAEVAGSLRDVPAERLNAHPGHDNSIAWLLWHAAREIDVQVAQLSGEQQEWTRGGWAEKLGVDRGADAMGYGDSPDQTRALVVNDANALVDHLEAVTAAHVAYLDTLTDADLDDVVDENWDPPVTRGARLVSVSEDALQHVGQASYLAGMKDSAFE